MRRAMGQADPESSGNSTEISFKKRNPVPGGVAQWLRVDL